VKFITDRSLGRLAKWLRILGYDTTYYVGDADRTFLKKAHSEGRVALTRKRELARRQFTGQMLMNEADRVEDQLRYVIDHYVLTPDSKNLFSCCLRCNAKLVPLRKEEAKELVPVYTYETQQHFMHCQECGSIFWPGTHKNRAEEFFRMRIPTGHR
jgi:hypothetical protein